MAAAGRALLDTGAAGILVKGGHLADADEVIDVLVTPTLTHAFRSKRIVGTMRGTGDILATSIAAGLARGLGLPESIETARRFVRRCIEGAQSIGGMRVAADWSGRK